MNKIIIDAEEDVIDLTNEFPNGTTSTTDVELINDCIITASHKPCRRKTNDSEVEIIEDAPLEKIGIVTLPPVACHFFYPCEEDGEGIIPGEEEFQDPLAPVPEWVDCSTIQSDQEGVGPLEEQEFSLTHASAGGEPLTLEAVPETTSSSLPVTDPLGISYPVKIEPGTAVDIKPSVSQLLGMDAVENNLREKNVNNFEQSGAEHVSIKKEISNDDCNLSNKITELKGSQDTNVNASKPKRVTKNGRIIGPLCAKSRFKKRNQNQKTKCDLSDSPPLGYPHSESDKTTNSSIKIETFNLENSNGQTVDNKTVQYDNSKTNKTRKLSKDGRIIGPLCVQNRYNKQNRNIKKPHSESSTNNVQHVELKTSSAEKAIVHRLRKKRKNSLDIELTISTPSKKVKTERIVGPLCVQNRNKKLNDKEENDLNNSVSLNTAHFGANNTVPKPFFINIGPKLPLPECFKQKDITTSEEFHSKKYDEERPENQLEKTHIVLKIYTCFRCNHKCTDPLFHEFHINNCNSKRRSDSLNLSPQDCEKKNGYYRCGICIFKFKNEESLSAHFSQHSGNGFICHICQLNFPTLNQLYHHTNNDHKNLEKVFSCNVCEYSSLNVFHLKEHVTRHNSDRHLYCSSCKINFEDSDGIKKHREEFHLKTRMKLVKDIQASNVKNIHEERVVNLKYKKNISQQAMENNEKSNGNETFDDPIEQKEEKKKNKSTSELTNNDNKDLLLLKSAFESEIIHKDGRYHCNGCVYKFIHLKNLIKHKKHHLKSNPLCCPECEFKSFSIPDILKHMSSHDEYIIECSVCTQTFTCKNVNFLKRHMVRHIHDGLYCYRCTKNMENSIAFQKHISEHKGGTGIIHSCNECSYRTTLLKNLQKHMRRHLKYKVKLEVGMNTTYLKEEVEHKNEVSTAGNPKTNVISGLPLSRKLEAEVRAAGFSCKVCCLKFNSAIAIKEHNAVKHAEHCKSLIVKSETENGQLKDSNSSVEFKCKKCSFKCSQPGMYFEHTRNGHTKRKFICNICKSNFATLKRYLKHMKSHAACAVVYSCNECQFTCRKDQMFGKHMMVHARKYCPLCDFYTLRTDTFKTHLEGKHKIEKTQSFHTKLDTAQIPSKEQQNGSSPLKAVSLTFNSNTTDQNLKSHTCCFCPYKSTRIYNLRIHMRKHFSNANSKVSDKASKPSFVVNRWKSKYPSKSSQNKVSNPPNKVDNCFTLFYSCSQCGYKKNLRKSVSHHLFTTHNIIGGVRNHMIKKVYVKVAQTERRKTKKGLENYNMIAQKSTSDANQATPWVPQDVEISSANNYLKSNVIGVDKKNVTKGRSKKKRGDKLLKSQIINCASCDVENLSLVAQVQHKKYGHKDFWSKPFSCEICGFRSANNGSQIKHKKFRHSISKKEPQLSDNIDIAKMYVHKSKLDTNEAVSCVSDLEISSENNFPKYNANETKKEEVNDKKKGDKLLTSKPSKCSLCDFEKLPRIAQGQHKRYGHTVFWSKPFSCNLCGYRSAHKVNQLKHHNLRHSVIREESRPTEKNEVASITAHEIQFGTNQAMLFGPDMGIDSVNMYPDSAIIEVSEEKVKEGEIEKKKGEKISKSHILKCDSCTFENLSLIAQLQHEKYGHAGFWSKSFACNLCGYRTADKANQSKHYKSRHSASRKESLQTDKVQIARSLKNISSRSSEVISSADTTSVKKNADVSIRDEIIKCSECNIEQLPRKAQLQHKKLGHKTFWEKPFSCDICNMRCSNVGNLAKHKITHNTHNLTCTKCNSFTAHMVESLLVHEQSCSGSREIKMESDIPDLTNYLPSSVKVEENEVKHLTFEDENYVCGECDFATTDVIEFSTHMFVHSGIPDD